MLMLHIDSLMGAKSAHHLRQYPAAGGRSGREGRDPFFARTRDRALSALRRKPAAADRQARRAQLLCVQSRVRQKMLP